MPSTSNSPPHTMSSIDHHQLNNTLHPVSIPSKVSHLLPPLPPSPALSFAHHPAASTNRLKKSPSDLPHTNHLTAPHASNRVVYPISPSALSLTLPADSCSPSPSSNQLAMTLDTVCTCPLNPALAVTPCTCSANPSRRVTPLSVSKQVTPAGSLHGSPAPGELSIVQPMQFPSAPAPAPASIERSHPSPLTLNLPPLPSLNSRPLTSHRNRASSSPSSSPSPASSASPSPIHFPTKSYRPISPTPPLPPPSPTSLPITHLSLNFLREICSTLKAKLSPPTSEASLASAVLPTSATARCMCPTQPYCYCELGLVDQSSSPAYMQRAYIQHGYRSGEGGVMACVRSMFQLHNDSLLLSANFLALLCFSRLLFRLTSPSHITPAPGIAHMQNGLAAAHFALQIAYYALRPLDAHTAHTLDAARTFSWTAACTGTGIGGQLMLAKLQGQTGATSGNGIYALMQLAMIAVRVYHLTRRSPPSHNDRHSSPSTSSTSAMLTALHCALSLLPFVRALPMIQAAIRPSLQRSVTLTLCAAGIAGLCYVLKAPECFINLGREGTSLSKEQKAENVEAMEAKQAASSSLSSAASSVLSLSPLSSYYTKLVSWCVARAPRNIASREAVDKLIQHSVRSYLFQSTSFVDCQSCLALILLMKATQTLASCTNIAGH